MKTLNAGSSLNHSRSKFTKSQEREGSSDWELKKQIRRAAISAMSNVAEGFERDGNKEFINFLSIAKGSSGEIRAQLYIARERKYISEVEFCRLSESAREVSRTIEGMMRYLKGSKMKGRKYY